MIDNIAFSARLSGNGEYLTVRIPVRELPRTLRAQPARMQIRVIPQARLATATNVATPTYLLALDADLIQASIQAGNTPSNKTQTKGDSLH